MLMNIGTLANGSNIKNKDIDRVIIALGSMLVD